MVKRTLEDGTEQYSAPFSVDELKKFEQGSAGEKSPSGADMPSVYKNAREKAEKASPEEKSMAKKRWLKAQKEYESLSKKPAKKSTTSPENMRDKRYGK